MFLSMTTNKKMIMKKYLDTVSKFMPTDKIWRGLKNASYLTIGYFLSLFINFFGLIFIARLLGPSDYGIYAAVVAFVGLFTIINLTGITKVVLREGAKNLDKMGYYLERTTGIKILFTLIAIMACIIFAFLSPYSFREQFYIFVFSFTLIDNSFHGFFGSVFQAAEKMQYNSVLTILRSVLFVPISIAFLYMGFGLLALFLISLFSHFITLIISYRLTKRFLIFKFWNKIKWDKSLLIPAIIFSILSFTYLLTTKIDVVMISWLSTSKDVGLYGVAHQITFTGVSVRNLLGVAFFPIFVKSFHKNMVRWRNLLKYAFILGFVLLILAVLGSFLSRPAINLLFGLSYSESGVILSVLIFYLALVFFSIPFTNTLQATHNERNILKVCWISPTINIGLNYLFFNIFGLIGIAYSTLVVGFVSVLITVLVTWSSLKKQNKLI